MAEKSITRQDRESRANLEELRKVDRRTSKEDISSDEERDQVPDNQERRTSLSTKIATRRKPVRRPTSYKPHNKDAENKYCVRNPQNPDEQPASSEASIGLSTLQEKPANAPTVSSPSTLTTTVSLLREKFRFLSSHRQSTEDETSAQQNPTVKNKTAAMIKKFEKS